MVSSCTGDDSDEPDSGSTIGNEVAEFGAELEGIYELTLHETNLNACETGGATTLGHTFLAVYATSFPSISTVDVISCEGVEPCRESVMAARDHTSYLVNFHFIFDDQASPKTITGKRSTTVQAGELCHRQVTDVELIESAEGLIEIEARIWLGADYPVEESSGSCDSDDGPDPDLDAPCTQLETLTAERVADL
jgi:hypothetical protein